MNLENLNNLLSNEPKFRHAQAYEALFSRAITDWSEATTLPKNLQTTLNQEFPLAITHQLFESGSDETLRALITLDDGNKIETVLMRHGDRNTVCVSSQVGCPLGCTFCATGKLGFKRNLTVTEILLQILLFNRLLKKDESRVSNVVFMGMGEPLLNYDNVIGAIKKINDINIFNISYRKISVSTIGIPDKIKKLAHEDLPINLALSLHAPDDQIRRQLIPVANEHKLADVLKVLNYYKEKTNRKVMLEYLMIKNLNDHPDDAVALAKLLKKHLGSLFVINLIAYNDTGVYTPAPPENIKAFKKILERERLDVTERYRMGRDIDAACGQLARSTKQRKS